MQPLSLASTSLDMCPHMHQSLCTRRYILVAPKMSQHAVLVRPGERLQGKYKNMVSAQYGHNHKGEEDIDSPCQMDMCRNMRPYK
jgi:hypothetical protein